MVRMSNLGHSTAISTDFKPPVDSLTVALDAVNDRWALHVIRALAFGASRFNEIVRTVGAPRDVLSSRLKQLVASGIVQRRAADAATTPGYELTQKGRDLGQVMLVLKRWGDTYSDPSVPRPQFTHEACGNTLVADVRCTACNQHVGPGELTVGDHEAETT